MVDAIIDEDLFMVVFMDVVTCVDTVWSSNKNVSQASTHTIQMVWPLRRSKKYATELLDKRLYFFELRHTNRWQT